MKKIRRLAPTIAQCLTLAMLMCLTLVHTAHAQTQAAAKPEKHANIHLAWDWPSELSGIFAKGMFDNCCFDGEESVERYYYIKLDQTVYVKDIVKPGEEENHDDFDADSVQLGISIKDLPPGLSPGTPISIHCNQFWEGDTGHYALSVYCDNPSITILPENAKRPPSRIGPSFECVKAHSTVEKLICGDNQLAYLDGELSVLYVTAKDKAKGSAAFKEQTATEWKWREANCKDKACLVSWYARRKGQLESVAH